MAILPDKVWARHTNKWSGWSRVLSMPMLGVGMYFHSWLILLLSVIWLIMNPWIFPRPRSIDNWMSRGVVGEKLYFKDGKKLQKDLPTFLNLLNIPIFAAFLYFGWQREVIALVLSGALVMVVKFWFIDRMNQVYEKEKLQN